MILEGKRILVTGVVNRRSIAFSIAERAQAAGRRGAADQLRPDPADDRARRGAAARAARGARARRQQRRRPGGAARASSQGAGAGSTAPSTRSPSPRPTRSAATSWRPRASSAETAFETSAYSFKALARALAPLMEEGEAAWSGSTSTPPSPGPPTTGWASPRRRWSRSAATSPATSGPRGVRVNLVAAGPIRTAAASGIPGFAELESAWAEQAPLGWEVERPDPGRRHRPLPALRPRPRDHRRDPPRRRRRPRDRRRDARLSSGRDHRVVGVEEVLGVVGLLCRSQSRHRLGREGDADVDRGVAEVEVAAGVVGAITSRRRPRRSTAGAFAPGSGMIPTPNWRKLPGSVSRAP